uniref:Uncharacterized protein n=1 Tax=Rhizophora mucronata TaxID=61149 RepID=A0A2P2PFL7_RHIMU
MRNCNSVENQSLLSPPLLLLHHFYWLVPCFCFSFLCLIYSSELSYTSSQNSTPSVLPFTDQVLSKTPGLSLNS